MNRNYYFETTNLDAIDISEFNAYINKSVFTTLSWIRFVEKDSKAEPVVIRISDGENTLGYFTALVTKKIGVRIVGSPFSGWSTCYMGIDTNLIGEKKEMIRQLVPYLFKTFRCQFIQIIDRDITVDEAIAYGFHAKKVGTLELDINMSDEALFKQMKTDCRNFIRQFERRGARIEVAQPNEEFAKQYYSQLIDVFAKQGLVPTYSLEKVITLMENLKDSGNLLCLRVISPEEKCIATSIFIGHGKKFFFWGGASYREDQHYRPNEYMIWTAIKYWREKGCQTFDMVGIRDYKRKFGSNEVYYASMEFSKNKLLPIAKSFAQKAYYKMTAIKGTILKRH